jgi:hypothetical protein
MARSVAFALAATCHLLRWCRERQVRGFRRTYHGWPSNGRKCRSMAVDPRERMSVGPWKQPLLSRWPSRGRPSPCRKCRQPGFFTNCVSSFSLTWHRFHLCGTPTQANPADTVIDAINSSMAPVARSRECVAAAAANQKTSNEHQLGTKSAKIKNRRCMSDQASPTISRWLRCEEGAANCAWQVQTSGRSS